MVYERKLSASRLFVGEETDLTIQITNAKPLPLAWLKVEDELPAEVTLARGRLHRSYKPNRRLLTNTLSLRFYERVRKQYHLQASQARRLSRWARSSSQSGDLFGLRRHERVLEQLDELVVYPLVVPVAAFDLVTAHPFGEQSCPAPSCRRPAADRRHTALRARRQPPLSALEGDGPPRQPADQDL